MVDSMIVKNHQTMLSQCCNDDDAWGSKKLFSIRKRWTSSKENKKITRVTEITTMIYLICTMKDFATQMVFLITPNYE